METVLGVLVAIGIAIWLFVRIERVDLTLFQLIRDTGNRLRNLDENLERLEDNRISRLEKQIQAIQKEVAKLKGEYSY